MAQRVPGPLTQSGGELNGSGTLTVTGSGSGFSSGTESGSGTTNVQGGATFTSTSFGLDGGRTLQLGGGSAATGAQVNIGLNALCRPVFGSENIFGGISAIGSAVELIICRLKCEFVSRPAG
jgi:hypothetical protein